MAHIKEFLHYVNLICDRGRSFSPFLQKQKAVLRRLLSGGSIDAPLAW